MFVIKSTALLYYFGSTSQNVKEYIKKELLLFDYSLLKIWTLSISV